MYIYNRQILSSYSGPEESQSNKLLWGCSLVTYPRKGGAAGLNYVTERMMNRSDNAPLMEYGPHPELR
jgi:hypothetical protein